VDEHIPQIIGIVVD